MLQIELPFSYLQKLNPVLTYHFKYSHKQLITNTLKEDCMGSLILVNEDTLGEVKKALEKVIPAQSMSIAIVIIIDDPKKEMEAALSAMAAGATSFSKM